MKKTIPVLLTVVLAFVAGCGEKEESFSRYPSLSVPQYKTEDYIRDLSSSDPEVVYNAICNLSSKAAGFSNILWGEDPDTESSEYQAAQRAYNSVLPQLQSEEPMLVAVSLRFMQKFVKNKGRTELIEPVCAIESSSPLIQFEQVKLLSVLVTEVSTLPEPLLDKLINSESLIVSGASYALLGKLSDERWRGELLTRYQASEDEIEQLVLLAAYGRKSDSNTVSFLQHEMLAATNPKIRQCAFDVIIRNIDSPDVLPWVSDHFLDFSREEQERIFDSDIEDSDAALELMRTILEKGYDPGDEFLQGLVTMKEIMPVVQAEEDIDEEFEELMERALEIEKVVVSYPELAARMEPMREEVRRNVSRMTSMESEYEPLVEEFSDKARAFLTEHGVSEEEQDEFLEEIPGLDALDIFQNSLSF